MNNGIGNLNSWNCLKCEFFMFIYPTYFPSFIVTGCTMSWITVIVVAYLICKQANINFHYSTIQQHQRDIRHVQLSIASEFPCKVEEKIRIAIFSILFHLFSVTRKCNFHLPVVLRNKIVHVMNRKTIERRRRRQTIGTAVIHNEPITTLHLRQHQPLLDQVK